MVKFRDSTCCEGCRIVEDEFLPGLDKACKHMYKSAQAMLNAIKDCIPYVQAVLNKYGLANYEKSSLKLESESNLYEAQKVFNLAVS